MASHDHPRERQVLGAVAQDVEDEADPVEAIVPLPEGGEGGRGRDGPVFRPARARRGSWRAARARRGPRRRPATPSTPTLPVISGATGDRALGDVAQRGRELLRGVAEHELQVQLLADAEHRVDRVGLHAHARPRRCACRAGAAAMIWSSTPGTPTHSKTTAGRSGGPGIHGGSAGARRRRRARPPPRASSATASSARDRPRRRRRAPRPARGGAAEKSAATIGPSAVQPERRDHREADRAAADHQRRVVRLEARLGHRVQAHRHRLGERGVLGGEPVRHREQQRLGEPHVLARSRPGCRSSSRRSAAPVGADEARAASRRACPT